MLIARELRIVTVLAGIFALRMLGLCMLLPVFALEALNYSHANTQLIGLAAGIYGLAQASLQIPFGLLSDRFGRKTMINLGLILLLLGSLIAYLSTSIYGLILGRSLQGCAAIGSVIIATMIDHTREQARSVAMAILGGSIGLAFALAMVLGPWLNNLFGFSAIFLVMALVSGLALVISTITIPKSASCKKIPDLRSLPKSLLNLNFAVFALHASLAALFLVLPSMIAHLGFAKAGLWQLYSVVLVLAFLITLKFMRQLQTYAVFGLLIAELGLFAASNKFAMVLSLTLFFTAFCVLEASLPSMVAKAAPPQARGTALGVYSSLQFLGMFVGGVCGGWLQAKFGVAAVIGFCCVLAITWLGMSFRVNREQGLNYG